MLAHVCRYAADHTDLSLVNRHPVRKRNILQGLIPENGLELGGRQILASICRFASSVSIRPTLTVIRYCAVVLPVCQSRTRSNIEWYIGKALFSALPIGPQRGPGTDRIAWIL